MITLSAPVYDFNARRLVSVVGVDILFSEIRNRTGLSDGDARTAVRDYSLETRKCDNRKFKSCDAQALRFSQNNSYVCPDTRKSKTDECYSYNKRYYTVSNISVSFDTAKKMCNDTGGTLAIIGDEDENRVLTELVSPDGSWIGLRVERGSLKWVNDKDVLLSGSEFAVNNSIEIDDDDICILADRRGILENWVTDRCTSLHPFVCEFSSEATCLSSIGRISSENVQPLSTPCPDLDRVDQRICDGIPDAIDMADPLCKQTGSDYSEADRTCCGGKADITTEESPTGSLNIALISGAAGGAAFVLILVLAIVLAMRHRRSRDRPIEEPPYATKSTKDNYEGAKVDGDSTQIQVETDIGRKFGDQRGISTARDFGIPSSENGSQQGPGERPVSGIGHNGTVQPGTNIGRVSNDTKTTEFPV